MDKQNLCGLILGLALALPTYADTPALNPAHPEQYVVQVGDTLWDISGRFLQDAWRWPDIWDRNPQIDNPHLIYPGDIVSLTYEGGKPVIRVRRPGMAGPAGAAAKPAVGAAAKPGSAARSVGPGVVKLSPKVRVLPRDAAIPTIPLDVINAFLNDSRVVSENEFNSAPYVVSMGKEHLLGGPEMTAYARRVDDGSPLQFQVYRRGQVYREPGERVDGMYDGQGEVLGLEALYVGDAVLQQYGDPSALRVTNATREVLPGDRLFPVAQDPFPSSFIPRAFDQSTEGQIVAVIDGVTQIGQYNVVVLNLGRRDGIEMGHVLAVSQQGEVVVDKVLHTSVPEEAAEVAADDPGGGLDYPYSSAAQFPKEDVRGTLQRVFGWSGEEVKLPDRRAGIVMVFRPYERVSYALVMKATRAIHLYDIVSTP